MTDDEQPDDVWARILQASTPVPIVEPPFWTHGPDGKPTKDARLAASAPDAHVRP